MHNVFYKGALRFNRFDGEPDYEGVKAVLGRLRGVEGWRVSRARNRYWFFRCKLGRVRLFLNGTVELWVRKPASLGKAKGLFSKAFVWSGAVDSIKVCEDFYKSLMVKMHAVFDYGKRVDYMRVTAFKGTHGFELVTGDKSHPTCAEFMFEYHAEVEEARRLFEQMSSFFGQFGKENGKVKPLKDDYSF